MNDKIQPLFAGQSITGVQNDNTVALLEHILARAKTGEIQNVAIAACTSDNAIVTCFDPGDKTVSLLGALVRLTGRIERSMGE